MDSRASAFLELVEIIRKLRDPQDGCPWDKEQTHTTLKPYLIEESYELLEAIDSGSTDKISAELGDVLLQVVLHAQVASDSGDRAFDIERVCKLLSEKLIRRHPHIFSDAVAETSQAVLKNWEKIKARERKEKESALDGVPTQLPALLKAQRLGEKTARLGFDWTDSEQVLVKIVEELDELHAASSKQEQFEEFGDLLFTLVQWGRHKKLDCEEALRSACAKFASRFKHMEQASSKPLSELSLEEKEALWTSAKSKA